MGVVLGALLGGFAQILNETLKARRQVRQERIEATQSFIQAFGAATLAHQHTPHRLQGEATPPDPADYVEADWRAIHADERLRTAAAHLALLDDRPEQQRSLTSSWPWSETMSSVSDSHPGGITREIAFVHSSSTLAGKSDVPADSQRNRTAATVIFKPRVCRINLRLSAGSSSSALSPSVSSGTAVMADVNGHALDRGAGPRALGAREPGTRLLGAGARWQSVDGPPMRWIISGGLTVSGSRPIGSGMTSGWRKGGVQRWASAALLQVHLHAV